MDPVLAGRYELDVLLGRGGSGEVWRAKDMATGQLVAIKLVELSLINDPNELAETVSRFRRETMVVEGLKHPNIVGAIDAGRVGGQLFMVMELAPGISLAAMMEQRATQLLGLFPVSSVLRIAEQVCIGLGAAHEAGIVHRDVKPSNLMVTPQLDVKIIDFGISRIIMDNSPRLTLPTHTIGTIAYMSPEQAQGFDVDGRGDLYSLGCVLYQLLAGRLPFKSSLPGALLMMQVMDSAIPMRVVRPELPPGLAELVSDLMEKDPAARPQDAGQVIGRIAEIEAALGEEAPEQEADRATIRGADWPVTAAADLAPEALGEAEAEGADATDERREPEPAAAAQAAATAESGPESPWIDELAAESARAATPGRGETLAAGAVGAGSVAVTTWAPQPPTWVRPTTAQPVAAVAPARGVPAQSGPSRVSGDHPPAWPVVEPRPRSRHQPRRPWRAIVSTLITLAIAAAAGIYAWERTHGSLTVNNVAVTVADPSLGCNGTQVVTATISTNGRGGAIEYEWIRDAEKNPTPLVVSAASGSGTVTVTLRWAFHGKGTENAVADFRVLTPDPDEASVTFPYSCRLWDWHEDHQLCPPFR
jgi:eukaryotic-like serine/threonine-protein kinase